MSGRPEELPDAELVAMLQSEDPKKLEQGYKFIMHFYVPLLLRYAHTRGINGPDAEDAIADILASLPRYMRSFRSSGSFRSFLVAVFRHRLVDYWRRASRSRENITNLDIDSLEMSGQLGGRRDFASPDMVLSETESARDLKLLLAQAFERLSPQDTLLLRMRYIENASLPAVAEALAISQGTAARRLHRALQKLRTTLESVRPEEQLGNIHTEPFDIKEHE